MPPKSQLQTKTGILLINLGTPDAPETRPVRKYLRQFLSDPRVIDINPFGRFLLLNLIILPFRAAHSAAAYRSIWTKEGSPILNYGKGLEKNVQKFLDQRHPGKYAVKLGMRYGQPSIESVIDQFIIEDVMTIRVLPLFPQYASATFASALEEVYRVVNKKWNMPSIQALKPFYDNDQFLESFAHVAMETIGGEHFDHFLFSFHGLPERHIRKSEPPGQPRCLVDKNCCSQIEPRNRYCYRIHCFTTARGIARKMGLTEAQWSVSFQSRLGRDPWIRPYTDQVIRQLPKDGITSLAVLSPAFVADCLETLEELGIRGKEDFLAAGGENYRLIPSLNVHPKWVTTVADLVTTS